MMIIFWLSLLIVVIALLLIGIYCGRDSDDCKLFCANCCRTIEDCICERNDDEYWTHNFKEIENG